MTLRLRDNDGDIPTGTIRLNTDGLEIRDLSNDWVTIAPTNDEFDRFRYNLTTAEEYRTSAVRDWTEQIMNTSRRYSLFDNVTRPLSTPNDLVLVDMKVENIGDYKFKTVLIYIDRQNYQEVKQEYMSSLTMSHNFDISGDSKLEIKLEQTGEMTETRKDI